MLLLLLRDCMLDRASGRSAADGMCMAVQLKGLPFIAFDQGGVMEMIESRDLGNSIILEPSADALLTRLTGDSVLTRVTERHAACLEIGVSFCRYLGPAWWFVEGLLC